MKKNNSLMIAGKILLGVVLLALLICQIIMMKTYTYSEYSHYYDEYYTYNYSLMNSSDFAVVYFIFFIGIVTMSIIHTFTRNRVLKFILYPFIGLNCIFLGVLSDECPYYIDAYDAFFPIFIIGLHVAIASFVLTCIGQSKLTKENQAFLVENKKVEAKYVSKKEDVYDNLKKLKEMYDDGILTKEEYEEKRSKYVNDL